MNARFIASNPRQIAQVILDDLFLFGTDQIAISCAFLTAGGVELLRPHAARLRLASSFVVVAWSEPTALPAVTELHNLIPGKVYLHLGALTPSEKGVGPGLMHSKVFFARAGSRCRLWTGSHNLTASAVEGVNCEAAVLLEGTVDEKVFVDALAHLSQCRREAIPFDPLFPPPALKPPQTLIIHAECHTALKATPWHVHLRPSNTDYDRAMRPPAPVWLFLHDPGSLRVGLQRRRARAAYSGTLTALNFTETHPRYSGIPAVWHEDYIVQVERGVPRLTDPGSPVVAPSQGVLYFETAEDPDTVWMKANPEPKVERVVGETRVSKVDRRFEQYFTKQSIAPDGGLVHREYRSVKRTIRLSRKEIGDEEIMRSRLQPTVPLEFEFEDDLRTDDKFAFIYRARFRT